MRINRTGNWKPGVSGQRGTILSNPAEVEIAVVCLAAPDIIVSEEDAAQSEVSSRLQVSDGGDWSDGEEREVNVSDGFSVLQADVGAGVGCDEVTEGDGAVGFDGHAAGLVWVRPHLTLDDLLGVPHLATFVEGPGDWGAVLGLRFETWQEGFASKSAVHKHGIFFAPHIWKHKSHKNADFTNSFLFF